MPDPHLVSAYRSEGQASLTVRSQSPRTRAPEQRHDHFRQGGEREEDSSLFRSRAKNPSQGWSPVAGFTVSTEGGDPHVHPRHTRAHERACTHTYCVCVQACSADLICMPRPVYKGWA